MERLGFEFFYEADVMLEELISGIFKASLSIPCPVLSLAGVRGCSDGLPSRLLPCSDRISVPLSNNVGDLPVGSHST